MSPQAPTTALVQCLGITVIALNELCDALGAPFLKSISSTTASLLVSIQDTKRNQDQCLLLMERVQPLLLGIIRLHIEAAELPPAILKEIDKFTETLHKIYVFIEAQHDRGIIKRWFRANENSALFNDCKAGLEHAFEAFNIQIKTSVWKNVEDMRRDSETMHEKVLEIVAGISSDRAQSDTLSSLQSRQTSSDSLSMLPGEPKIFHGREAEVARIVNNLTHGPTQIVILGPGGIGKTSLARAVLHNPLVVSKYTRMFFIPCDSAPTCSELIGLVALHLGLDPGGNPTKSIIRFFSTSPPTLLVLDNFETPWENAEDRGEVEEFLALLADVTQLALIITMRGAERPAGVQWTRPFMAPLAPLTNEAALQMFTDIVDDVRDMGDVQKLLALTDNLPLAVDIIAHLAEYEGCGIVLSKWEDQKTSLLALGTDCHALTYLRT
ncbi:P-loop containing nucleoside triphosphate hydrolase protein [Roridomyces roridus]|uniref:P-loop containing nucleoside triphosphate hydrolase protein n=1 Tax=Roridomyces roridus TaxID=1738132 RepID=A0AAD7BSC7_9AGAR|nr:P-loop containing nucleoside triphosphate hydrolase protein [Roridomyces roridus]